MQEQDFWENGENDDPFSVFGTWMREAEKMEEDPVNAAAVASTDKNGHPSVRIMLLKGVDHNGFVFFTNFHSKKGKDFSENPEAAFNLYWKTLGRQICVRGSLEHISSSDSDEYFQSRPRGSRIASAASKQSTPLPNRQQFLDEVEELTKSCEGKDVPRPEYWHGFRVIPRYIEFFQDGEYRMHYRRIFTREDPSSDNWETMLLYP